MTEQDKLLIKIYKLGFHDGLYVNPDRFFTKKILSRAYLLGRINAIIGDDIRNMDYITDEQILSIIKNEM